MSITGCSVHNNGLGSDGGEGIALRGSAVDNATVAGNRVSNNGPTNAYGVQDQTNTSTDTEGDYEMGIYVGFDGPIRPDHVPVMHGEGDDYRDAGEKGRLFAVGYMNGLLEAVES